VVAPVALASDSTAPQVVLVSPADGDVFYQGELVQAAWGCLAGTLGWPVMSCEGDVPLGGWLDTSSAGMHSFSVRAVDYDGAETTVTHTYTVVDVIAPTAKIAAPTAGTYAVGERVYVSYSCDDEAGSGIVGCIGTYPNGYPLPTAQPGAFVFTVEAFDAAGNHSSTSVSYRVADETPPRITITSPADGTSYLVGEPITPLYSCHDDVDGSNVACKATPVDISPGMHVFRVDAVDAAGNASSATTSYAVHYPFNGFYAPLAAEPAVTSFKAGDTVPVKFSLEGDRGLGVVAHAESRPCSDSKDGATAALGSLAYNAGPDRYTFMWQSDKSWAGTCRAISIVLADGTSHTALTAFR
jgi:hypothetical protein